MDMHNAKAKAWLPIITFTALCGLATDLEARKMARGHVVPDEVILPNHPAVKDGPPQLVELVRRFGDAPAPDYCYARRKDGSVGNMTIGSLLTVANFSLTPDVFGNNIAQSELNSIAYSTDRAADWLARYALAKSKGDSRAAVAIIKAAEQSDAKCASSIARFWRTKADLST